MRPRFSEVDQVRFIIVFRKGFEWFFALEDGIVCLALYEEDLGIFDPDSLSSCVQECHFFT